MPGVALVDKLGQVVRAASALQPNHLAVAVAVAASVTASAAVTVAAARAVAASVAIAVAVAATMAGACRQRPSAGPA